MMEKRHRCKLCFRSFANGRALGGHMKSHMINLHDSSKNHQEQEDDHQQGTDEFQSADSSSPSSCSSFAPDDDEKEEEEEEDDEAKGLVNSSSYKLRENPRKSKLLADHDFSSDLIEEEEEHMIESDTQSSKENNRVFTGSKRKKLTSHDDDFLLPENEPSSSISDTATEEHLAHCLMMLSRDKWTREEIVEYNNLQEHGRFEDSGSAKKMALRPNNNKVRGRYRCETCNKLFKSYQALGGHRASHKKIKPAVGRTRPETKWSDEKLHKCPFCERVFASGQALGGHKRTHSVNGGGGILVNSPNVGSSSINSVGGNNNNGESVMIDIDLNLPAPIDEDDQGIISQVSNSDQYYF